MAFLGKEYKFVSQENFEEFVNSLGLPADQAQGYLNFKPSQKYEKDGDSYVYTSVTPSGQTQVKFQSGIAFDETNAGRKCKTAYTVDGNTVTQVQTYEDGTTFTFTRQFNGDDLTVTITSSKWDGVARRFYKA
ncbi:fatty acid-binding protein 1-like [Trichoplusia ni]|uniref:Fatty acid-binding protein 1-like n=1 Tax=Trichoplusia ni TaxID=7111 RepID=A0A7E5VI41_TRINI|nr:fatty acid-binding protein 1-like [Trichoplusia ni]